MGKVYRAADTNLKRQVTIKVLPASVAIDAERLARIRREAEVLPALNHPNIAQVHGLEKSDGMQDYSVARTFGQALKQWCGRPIPGPRCRGANPTPSATA
jgi:serine/threonine protein kinase